MPRSGQALQSRFWWPVGKQALPLAVNVHSAVAGDASRGIKNNAVHSSVCLPHAVAAVHLLSLLELVTPEISASGGALEAVSPALLCPGSHFRLITGQPAVSQPSQAYGPAEPSTSSPAGNAVFFTTYEGLRRTFPGRRQPERQDSTLLSVLADSASAITCGGIAGTVMWAVGVFAA